MGKKKVRVRVIVDSELKYDHCGNGADSVRMYVCLRNTRIRWSAEGWETRVDWTSVTVRTSSAHSYRP